MREPWFRRNERGLGLGLPIHRNGWILLGAYVGFLIAFQIPLEYLLGHAPDTLTRALTMLAVTIPFAWIVLQRTERGASRNN
jgi:hypothetical protein